MSSVYFVPNCQMHFEMAFNDITTHENYLQWQIMSSITGLFHVVTAADDKKNRPPTNILFLLQQLVLMCTIIAVIMCRKNVYT